MNERCKTCRCFERKFMKHYRVSGRMLSEKNPSGRRFFSFWTWDQCKKCLGEGKTLKQILDMDYIKASYRIWAVARFIPDEMNRVFAIWCARQFETDAPEIADYIDTAEKYYGGKATQEELQASYKAADSAKSDALSRNAFCAAHRAACRESSDAAYSVAHWSQLNELASGDELIKKLKHLILYD